MAEPSQISIKLFRNTWLALMGLLVLTIAMAHFNLGTVGLVIALVIATAKALLILMIFMEIHYSHKTVAVAAVAAYLWLAILIVGTFHDYVSRNWVPRPENQGKTSAPQSLRTSPLFDSQTGR